MLKLLFKTTAYYVIWTKFKKQIVLIFCSTVLIAFIGLIYEDIFEVLKVNNRDSIGALLFFKWLFISLIFVFNIYILKKTKVDKKEEKILKKREELMTSTDLLLKKYENRQ